MKSRSARRGRQRKRQFKRVAIYTKRSYWHRPRNGVRDQRNGVRDQRGS